MKIVYSYTGINQPDHISTNQLFLGLYSCIKSLEVYGNATFYSNKKLIDKFKQLGIPFSDYQEIEIDTAKYKTANLTKLEVYSRQKEPYIHIDLDLILFEKLNKKDTSGISFAHIDIGEDWNFSASHVLTDSYFEPGRYFSKIYGNSFLEKLRITQVPNMGIVAVDDVELMKRVTDRAIDFYYKHSNYFDEVYQRFCFLEQGLIHTFLIEESEKYKNDVETKNAYIFNQHITLYSDFTNNTVNLRDLYNQRVLHFDSMKEMISNYNYDNLPATHFLGDCKHLEYAQLLVIDKLIKEVGLDLLEKIQDMFGNKDNPNFLNTYNNL